MQSSTTTNARTARTIPAPSPAHADPAVGAYLRASERVRQALIEQAAAIEALRALDSRHPAPEASL